MTHFSHLCRRASLLALLLAVCSGGAIGMPATGLPDTGQDTCYDGTAMVACSVTNSGDTTAYPRQDGRYGRDAAALKGVLSKTGGGVKGFDYSKITNNGTVIVGDGASVPLGAGSSDWACTKDNTTGLTWEVKTTSGLRSNASTYTWYNSNNTTNGGSGYAGTINGGHCSGGSGCDTEKFAYDVNHVNTTGLCTYNDWRMPTQRELLTLVLLDGSSPSIDPSYFPNTQPSYFWSASSYVPYPAYAWSVGFNGGVTGTYYYDKSDYDYVRLVRGGQF